MPVTIVGNNTPTAGGVVYGDGTNYASTAAGTSGQLLVSAGSSAPTWSSSLSSPTLTNPTVTNYTETLFSANSGTAITLALTNGTFQFITLTGNATITMPAVGAGKSFIILLAQDATGGRTVTWSTVVWPSGTAPTITSTASKKDLFAFFSDGTNWYGITSGQNF